MPGKICTGRSAPRPEEVYAIVLARFFLTSRWHGARMAQD
jgi:hypothetical protein